MHPVAISQMNIGGTTLIPTQKSATASETTNALVLVRSCRLLQTRKIINSFPAIVRMERDQPRPTKNPKPGFHNQQDATSRNLQIRVSVKIMIFFEIQYT